ncbi:MAG: hypothetical protein PHI12_06865 [Dehalococcoidales bacterium]|nr:hypothetical protein [Dehalococcoidales bacterium]
MIGEITGVISLSFTALGFIYIFGFWRGQVDSDRKFFRECMNNYPPAKMYTMVETLWNVYVLDALHHRPDLAARGSGFKLKPQGESLVPDNVKTMLAKMPDELKNHEDIVNGYTVVTYLGLATIETVAREKGLSLQETIAILSTYLNNHTNHNHSAPVNDS